VSRIGVHVRPPAACSWNVMGCGCLCSFGADSTSQRDTPSMASKHDGHAAGILGLISTHSASSFQGDQGDQAKAIVEAKDAQSLGARWRMRVLPCRDGGDGSDDIIHPH
jgi:hypothetical protein